MKPFSKNQLEILLQDSRIYPTMKWESSTVEIILSQLLASIDKVKLYVALEKIKDTIKQAEADSNRMDKAEKEKFRIYCSAHMDAITSLKNLIEGM